MRRNQMTWMAAVLGTVALSGMASCAKGKDAGSAAVSVNGQKLTLGDVTKVTVTISGGIATPLVVPLVGGGAQYTALVSDLPIGGNYVFTASALNGTAEVYHGAATGVTIAKNATASVIIDMNQVAPAVAISNEAPVIDSFTASSLLVSQGDTVIIKGTAHDPDKGQTAAMGVAWTTTCAGSLSNEIDVLGSDNGAVPPATLTYTDGSSQVTFTALPAKGDGPCNVTVTVTDANGVLKNSASLTIVVNAASAAGSAKIIANLDTYPVISGLGIVAPATAPIVTGVAIPLFVTASDSDGDALNYSWVSPDCGADGTFGTANLATTTFTLKVGATETTCTFLVTVDDGKYPDGTAKGGVITNHLSLPVSGPGNTTETAPVFGYDYQSQTTIKGGDVVGMAIVATQGCVGGGTIGLAAVASDGTTLGASTPAALGLDPSVFTAALTYTAQAGAENGSPVTVTVTATCSTSGLKATHVFTLVPLNSVCNGVADGTNCTATASASNKCVLGASCLAGVCHVDTQVTCSQNGVDQCKANACVPTTGQCAVGNKPNNTACNDGLACTGASAPGDLCTAGVCGGVATVCSQTGVDQCKVNACVEPTGTCALGNKPDTTACNDHNGCTGTSNGTVDTCTAGVCGGAAVVCSPSNYVCTSLTDTTHSCSAPICMSPSWDRSTNTTAPVVGLSVGPDGNPWVVGTLFASFPLNLGSGVVTSSGGADIYLAQLNSAGAATQTLTFGDTGANDQIPSGVAVSKSGTVGVIGVYTSEIDFTANGGNGNLGNDYLATSTPGTGFYVSLLATPVAHNVLLGNGSLVAIASNPALDGFVLCGEADMVVAASTTRNGLLKGHTSSWVTGNGMDVVVAKLNADGSVLWGTQIGGVGDQLCESVAMDSNGDVLIAGNYGAGTPASFFTTSSPTPAAGTAFIYVAKLAGATGNVIAAQGWGTSGRSDVNAITAIDTSNILIAGSISGSVNFGSGVSLAYLGLTDAYVAKLSVSGTAISAVWANAYGDAAHDQSANGVAAGSNGYIYVGGTYSGSLGALGLSSASATSPDGFTAELTSDGQTVKCAQTYGDSAGTQGVLTLGISSTNKVFLAGSYSNSIQFSPLTALTTPGSGTAYGFMAGLGTP